MQSLAVDVPAAGTAGDALTLAGPWSVPAGTASRGGCVDRLRTSDRAAAEELFTACYPRLAGWVRRLVDDDDTAHDIATEAFTRLLSRWSSLDNPQSYLYMIATNLVRDHWRKMERERRAISKAAAGTDPEPWADPAQDVDIRDLLAALPARLREPFLLHYYAGFGVKEISVQLKRPEGTIKADLYHARARLKDALAEHGTKRAARPVPARRGAGGAGKDRGADEAGGAGAGGADEAGGADGAGGAGKRSAADMTGGSGQEGRGKRRGWGRTNAS